MQERGRHYSYGEFPVVEDDFFSSVGARHSAYEVASCVGLRDVDDCHGMMIPTRGRKRLEIFIGWIRLSCRSRGGHEASAGGVGGGVPGLGHEGIVSVWWWGCEEDKDFEGGEGSRGLLGAHCGKLRLSDDLILATRNSFDIAETHE